MPKRIPKSLVFLGLGFVLGWGTPPARAEDCVTKAGAATGITRGFAEYEALLIIRQVTGNWPFETDRIGKPEYKCTNNGVLWTCRAVAQVCRS